MGRSQRSSSQEEEEELAEGLASTSSTGLRESSGRGGSEERRVEGILSSDGLWEERRSKREKKWESRAERVEKVAAEAE